MHTSCSATMQAVMRFATHQLALNCTNSPSCHLQLPNMLTGSGKRPPVLPNWIILQLPQVGQPLVNYRQAVLYKSAYFMSHVDRDKLRADRQQAQPKLTKFTEMWVRGTHRKQVLRGRSVLCICPESLYTSVKQVVQTVATQLCDKETSQIFPLRLLGCQLSYLSRLKLTKTHLANKQFIFCWTNPCINPNTRSEFAGPT
jgi:hypothetical protein